MILIYFNIFNIIFLKILTNSVNYETIKPEYILNINVCKSLYIESYYFGEIGGKKLIFF